MERLDQVEGAVPWNGCYGFHGDAAEVLYRLTNADWKGNILVADIPWHCKHNFGGNRTFTPYPTVGPDKHGQVIAHGLKLLEDDSPVVLIHGDLGKHPHMKDYLDATANNGLELSTQIKFEKVTRDGEPVKFLGNVQAPECISVFYPKGSIYNVFPPKSEPIQGVRPWMKYPTQKPVSLFTEIFCRLQIGRGAWVIDPYAGSGAVMLAALSIGAYAVAVDVAHNPADVVLKFMEEVK